MSQQQKQESGEATDQEETLEEIRDDRDFYKDVVAFVADASKTREQLLNVEDWRKVARFQEWIKQCPREDLTRLYLERARRLGVEEVMFVSLVAELSLRESDE